MTTQDKIQKIIEKSIEGRYNGYVNPFCQECGNYEARTENTTSHDMFLDPLFWQALVSQISLDLKCGFVKCPAIGEHKKCVEEVAVRFFRINLDEGFDEAVDYIYNLIEK